MQPEEPESIHTELALLRHRIADLEQELMYAYVSNDGLLSMLDALDDGLLLLNSDNTVIAVNRAMAAILGDTPAELQGRTWEDLAADGVYALFDDLIQQTRRADHGHQRREQFTSSDGHHCILDIRTILLPQRHQQNSRLIIHVVDVTERLHLKAMLIQSERQTATARLSATVAHEINTPLQAIKSMLYLAARSTDQQRSRYISRAGEQVDRIGIILKRLLDLHSVNDNPPTLVNINTLLEQLLDALQVTLTERRIQVLTEMQSDLPRLWGKPHDLHQVLLNLLLNAIEAMPGGGTIFIRVCQDDGDQSYRPYSNGNGDEQAAVLVEIADTGCGIKPEIQSRIFDPFFTTWPEGSGLGLAVSRKIITEHGGQITVRSTPDEGSTFLVRFPLPSDIHV